MEAMHLGPNGALIYCMEYLAENFDWFEEQLSDFGEDDYLVLDCPAQIELYSHVNVMKRVSHGLQQQGFAVCGVFLVRFAESLSGVSIRYHVLRLLVCAAGCVVHHGCGKADVRLLERAHCHGSP